MPNRPRIAEEIARLSRELDRAQRDRSRPWTPRHSEGTARGYTPRRRRQAKPAAQASQSAVELERVTAGSRQRRTVSPNSKPRAAAGAADLDQAQRATRQPHRRARTASQLPRKRCRRMRQASVSRPQAQSAPGPRCRPPPSQPPSSSAEARPPPVHAADLRNSARCATRPPRPTKRSPP